MTNLQVVRASAFDLGQLWREAACHGRPYLVLEKDGRVVAKIARALGNSNVETKFCRATNPEAALHEAIQEAELWGLPKLDDNT